MKKKVLIESAIKNAFKNFETFELLYKYFHEIFNLRKI